MCNLSPSGILACGGTAAIGNKTPGSGIPENLVRPLRAVGRSRRSRARGGGPTGGAAARGRRRRRRRQARSVPLRRRVRRDRRHGSGASGSPRDARTDSIPRLASASALCAAVRVGDVAGSCSDVRAGGDVQAGGAAARGGEAPGLHADRARRAASVRSPAPGVCTGARARPRRARDLRCVGHPTGAARRDAVAVPRGRIGPAGADSAPCATRGGRRGSSTSGSIS